MLTHWVGFQVLGHVKTIGVVAVGWLYFDTAVTMRMAAGSACALFGMVIYSVSLQPIEKKWHVVLSEIRDRVVDTGV